MKKRKTFSLYDERRLPKRGTSALFSVVSLRLRLYHGHKSGSATGLNGAIGSGIGENAIYLEENEIYFVFYEIYNEKNSVFI